MNGFVQAFYTIFDYQIARRRVLSSGPFVVLKPLDKVALENLSPGTKQISNTTTLSTLSTIRTFHC